MRIRVLLNLGAGLPAYKQDEIHEVDDQVGGMLIGNHWAILLPDEPVVVQPVEELPTPDKFKQIRQHPDHLTRKPAAHRKRATKLNQDSFRKE